MKKILTTVAIIVASITTQDQNNDVNTQPKIVPPISRDSIIMDYVSMQGGQMILVQNKKVSKLKKDMVMKNGIIVKINGMVKTPDGQSFKLHEGDRVYTNGKIEGPEKSPV